MDRRQFKLKVRATWEEEINEEKENYLHELDPREDSLLPRFPVSPEDEAEAYENYLFDRMRQYDEDSANMLFDFRSSPRGSVEVYSVRGGSFFDETEDRGIVGGIA